jgi:hypothetical protein
MMFTTFLNHPSMQNANAFVSPSSSQSGIVTAPAMKLACPDQASP